MVERPFGKLQMPAMSVEASQEATAGARAKVEVYASDQRYGPTVAAPLAVTIGA